MRQFLSLFTSMNRNRGRAVVRDGTTGRFVHSMAPGKTPRVFTEPHRKQSTPSTSWHFCGVRWHFSSSRLQAAANPYCPAVYLSIWADTSCRSSLRRDRTVCEVRLLLRDFVLLEPF